MKSKNGKEKLVDVSLLSKTDDLKVEFDKILSEFELLKLCQRNINNKKLRSQIKRSLLKNISATFVI